MELSNWDLLEWLEPKINNKQTNNIKGWQGPKRTAVLRHRWWECNGSSTLKTVWQFLMSLCIHLSYIPKLPKRNENISPCKYLYLQQLYS